LFEVYRVPFEAGHVNAVGVDGCFDVVEAGLVLVGMAVFEDDFDLITGLLRGLAAVDVVDLVLITGCFGGLAAVDFVVFAVDDFLVWLVVEVVVVADEELGFALVVDFVVVLELESALVLLEEVRTVVAELVEMELD